MTALEKLIFLDHDARRFGFDWPNPEMILAQIVDECLEVREAIQGGAPPSKIQEEIGDLLHAVISLCLFSGFDIEDTIEKINKKFSYRMSVLKELTQKHGLKNLQDQDIDFMLNLWREVKELEKTSSSRLKTH